MSPADSGSPQAPRPQATHSQERLHVPSSALEPGPQDPAPRERGPRVELIPHRVRPAHPDNARRRPVSDPLALPDSGRHSPANVQPVPLPSVPRRADPAW